MLHRDASWQTFRARHGADARRLFWEPATRSWTAARLITPAYTGGASETSSDAAASTARAAASSARRRAAAPRANAIATSAILTPSVAP